MTNKEAIKILKDAKITYIAPNGKQLSNEALDMAIQALEMIDKIERFADKEEEE